MPPDLCVLLWEIDILIMNRLFSALLLSGVVILSVFASWGSGVSSPDNPLSDFAGEWEFEKAVYLERSSATSDYLVIFEMNNAGDLESLPACLHHAVKRISIGGIAQVDCVFESYCGRTAIVTLQDPQGDRFQLNIGCEPDELLKESTVGGPVFNVTGLDYWIEKIDDETITILKEAVCIDNAVQTHCAVRCIMKKLY